MPPHQLECRKPVPRRGMGHWSFEGAINALSSSLHTFMT
jgi:hypothetical protein